MFHAAFILHQYVKTLNPRRDQYVYTDENPNFKIVFGLLTLFEINNLHTPGPFQGFDKVLPLNVRSISDISKIFYVIAYSPFMEECICRDLIQGNLLKYVLSPHINRLIARVKSNPSANLVKVIDATIRIFLASVIYTALCLPSILESKNECRVLSKIINKFYLSTSLGITYEMLGLPTSMIQQWGRLAVKSLR